jgi:hypothetical protein
MTHVGPNQTAGPTAWPNRNLCELRGKKPVKPRLLFNYVGSRPLEPILTQTAHFLVPLQRLKSLNHQPQWRVGNFGENYQCGNNSLHPLWSKTLPSHDAEIEIDVGPEPGGSVQ